MADGIIKKDKNIIKKDKNVTKKIKQIYKKIFMYNLVRVDIPDNVVDIIYDLFVNDIIPGNFVNDIIPGNFVNDIIPGNFVNDIIPGNVDLTMNNDIIYLYCGVYYQYIKYDYKQAIPHYLLASEKGGNGSAMNNLALYYELSEKNIELAIKYYLMAIKKGGGNRTAMDNLALYYMCNQNKDNEELAVKYYLMAIENGYEKSMYSLLTHCKDNEKIYKLVIKYYLSMDINNICGLPIKMINGLLREKFDIELAIYVHKYLDPDNIYRFGQTIKHALL
jgi:tetratricopeptide (TPR) repeat protein